MSYKTTIETPELSRAFKKTTNSYKLFWVYALLSLVNRTSRNSFTLDEIICEMVVLAWHPVCFYRLTFGIQDKLQDIIIKIQKTSTLQSNSSSDEIRDYINSSSDIQNDLLIFSRYVPTRFLTPWFENELQGIPDARRTNRIKELSIQSQNLSAPCPYFFDEKGNSRRIHLNSSWHGFFLKNMGVSLSFVKYHLSSFLQRRNPNVPGIINKMQAPSKRNLTIARNFWNTVKERFITCSKNNQFIDIYSNNPIEHNFSIDHFLPWSFVTHDLLWNLVPVEYSTNSQKGNALPDLDIYLPRMANLHRDAISALKDKPRFMEDFANGFKQDIFSLMSQKDKGLLTKYRELILPLYQIAKNIGFEDSWVLSD